MVDIARRDLRALQGMVADDETFSDEVFGFHAQQAVEKALKAWLCLAVGDYPRVHDLEDLFRRLQDAHQEVPVSFLDLIELVDFAVQYRYQASEEEWPLDRDRVCANVAALLESVDARVAEAERRSGR